MSNGKKFKYLGIPLLVVAGLLLAAKVWLAGPGTVKPVNSGAGAVTIAAAEACYLEVTPKLLLSGSVEGETSAVISAKINGRIAQVLVEDGQTVTAGEALVRLDSKELLNAVAIAAEGVKRQQANYDNSKMDYERYKVLYEQKAVPKQQLDSAETKLRIAETDLSAAVAGLSTAQEQYEYGVVTSPVSGVVANRSAVIGQVVSAGLTLMTVEKIGQVYAVVNVEQKDMGMLKAGLAAEVSVDAFPQQLFTGSVDVINPAAAASSRMFRVKLKLDNEEARLKPGMFVKAGIVLGQPRQALFVPQSAVFQKQGIYYVYVVENGKVNRQKIDTGLIKEDWIEVKSGLPVKTRVAVTNVNTLKDGDSVRVTN